MTDNAKIAVIGGTGQLGAAIARRLAKSGHKRDHRFSLG